MTYDKPLEQLHEAVNRRIAEFGARGK